MQSCLRVLTTKVDNLKVTVTQLCPKFIINPNYLYLLVEEDWKAKDSINWDIYKTIIVNN